MSQPTLQLFHWIFLIGHGGFVLFLLFGWLAPPLRRAHALCVLFTALSWLGLGFFRGWGYCFLTDWHWRVLEQAGNHDLPASFIKYALDRLTGRDLDPRLVDLLTLGGFCIATLGAVRSVRRESQFLLDLKKKIFREITAPEWLRLLLTAAAVLFGLVQALRLAWTADDAFITFRYALNWARGLGPVFNAGERVEGYTNFLWMALLTPWAAAGWDLEIVAACLGVSCYVLLFVVVALRGGVLAGGNETGAESTPFTRIVANIPLTVPALALHAHLSVFATSGLETALFTLFVTAGYLEVLGGTPTDRPRGFVLLTLACLTRPDGLLLYAVAAIGIVLSAASGWRERLRPHLFFGAVYIPYWLIRFAYYGAPWPNTFYAKSADSAYFEQGLVYLGLYGASYWLLGLACFVSPILLLWRRIRIPGGMAIAASAFLAWSGYVAFVGGDFMFARFLIPITPLIFLVAEGSARRAVPALNTGPAATVFSLVCALGILLRYDPYRGRTLPEIAGISEEHAVYTRARRTRLRWVAEQLGPALRQAGPVVAFYGSQAALVYYWKLERAIEAETGLTDYALARRSLSERGRIGHEKRATREDLTRRGVDWALRAPDDLPAFRRLEAHGLGTFEILCYRRTVMDAIETGPDLTFVRFPLFLDGYLAGKPDRDRVRADLPEFEKFYFQCNDDRVRFDLLKKAAGFPIMSP